MKFLSGISLAALLMAGAVATPSFVTSLSPGGMVAPGTTTGNGGATLLADTGMLAFSFGGNTGSVEELALKNFTANPFGLNDVSFVFQVTVTGGNILNLTSGSYAIPGLLLDVQQQNTPAIPGFPAVTTQAVDATWTTNGTTVGFGFLMPNGLVPGDTSWLLIINTNMTQFQPGVFSLQDDQTGNFQGFVPESTVPEPSSLALLGTTLLGAAGIARRRLFSKK